MSAKQQVEEIELPECAICLEPIVNKGVPESCSHMFCFACLVEWSKVKASCPICKTPLKHIRQSFAELEKFKEYSVVRVITASDEDSSGTEDEYYDYEDYEYENFLDEDEEEEAYNYENELDADADTRVGRGAAAPAGVVGGGAAPVVLCQRCKLAIDPLRD